MNGSLAYHAGYAAEVSVEREYERRGFTVLARRWRGRGGEIDLILRNDDQVVFVEVKKSKSHDRAVSMLGARQLHRIQQTATEFLGTQAKGQLTPSRFDVALVDGIGAIKLIENVAFA